jgi:hypothetical protein
MPQGHGAMQIPKEIFEVGPDYSHHMFALLPSCSRNACCGFQLVHFTAVNCEVIMGFVSPPLHPLLLYSGVRETGRNLDHFTLLMLREDLLLL